MGNRCTRPVANVIDHTLDNQRSNQNSTVVDQGKVTLPVVNPRGSAFTNSTGSFRTNPSARRSVFGTVNFSDRYTFSAVVLGKGGEATVYKGTDKTNGIDVAIKIVYKKDVKRKESVNHLLKEVDILERMSHKGIMMLYDYFDEPTRFIMVLEAGLGGSLFEKLMRNGRLSEPDAQGIIFNLTTAVEYMHSMDVVHRDLKPENILMKVRSDNDLELMIADFGYAVICPDDSLTNQLGTPNYVAPEVLLRQPYGKSVDVWAIGVILFITLSGNFPFNHPSQFELFKLIAQCSYSFEVDAPKWEGVSEISKDLIRKILVVNVQERYTLADILAHPWMRRDEPEILNQKDIDIHWYHGRDQVMNETNSVSTSGADSHRLSG